MAASFPLHNLGGNTFEGPYIFIVAYEGIATFSRSIDSDQRANLNHADPSIMRRLNWLEVLSITMLAMTAGVVYVMLTL